VPVELPRHADAVLNLLRAHDGVLVGRDLRAMLNHGKWWWQRWSGSGFYTLMARLEDAGLVRGRWKDGPRVDGFQTRHRVYSLVK
jgi:DNA-binding PadR family transcriptional regulator